MERPIPEVSRNTQMDGLRGYAAIAVVVFHSILDRDPTLNQRVVRPTIQEAHGLYDVVTKIVFMAVSGETAVVLFFVLSGAVLFESLKRRHAAPAATAIGFSVRRVLRLYPTFFVCLSCCLAAFAATGAYSFEAGHFWPNAVLRDFNVLGASWTLQVEFLAIPFILVGFWCHQRFGVVGMAAAYAVFAAVLCAPWLRTHLVYLQRFLSCFALGIMIPTGLGAAIARRMSPMAWPAVLVAMLASRHVMGLHWWSMDAEQALAALLVTLLFYGRAGALGRLFDRGVSQYLGRMSYSLYLFNVVFLILVEHWTQGLGVLRGHPLEWGLLLSVPTLAAAIATAHVAEVGLERPSIALGRRLTRFSVHPAALPASAAARA
jgi:peptidoglycan/LPS O-acetylase OafA/YrhL